MNTSAPNSLDPLARTIIQQTQEAITNNSVTPDERRWTEWKATSFEYTDNGVVTGTLGGQQVSRPDWFRASQTLLSRITTHDVYKSTLEALKIHYPDHALAIPEYLQELTSAIIRIVLSDAINVRGAEIEALCASLLNDLANGPITYSATVNLNGVILRAQSIQIAVGVKLRQPIREDIEVASPADMLSWPRLTPLAPHAIAEIQYIGARDQMVAVQREVEHLVSVLRLFDVGAVAYASYGMESDAPVSWGARTTLGPSLTSSARERYVIRREDEDRLKTFWRAVAHKIPKDIYDFQKQVSPLTLAYDRYSDAVLQNGILERRIANAVMGLEALLLDEIQELSYRLGMRIAKALSLIGKKPLEVRERIQDAYRIRSLFAHGDHLSHREKAKLERKYGEMKNFMLPLFDYLRSLIVLMISINLDKEQMIDLLDDALIDPAKHDSLKSRLSPLTSLVSREVAVSNSGTAD
jgi:hypothetical protein